MGCTKRRSGLDDVGGDLRQLEPLTGEEPLETRQQLGVSLSQRLDPASQPSLERRDVITTPSAASARSIQLSAASRNSGTPSML